MASTIDSTGSGTPHNGVEREQHDESVLEALDLRTRHFHAVREISEALASALELQDTLEAITRITSGVMNVASCSIYLLDKEGERLVLEATTGLSRGAVGSSFLARGEGLTGWTVAHGEAVAAREARTDPRFKLLPETDETRLQSLLAMPLSVQGRTIGAINVQTREIHDFREEEISLLSLIANLAAGALEKAALYDSMRQRIRELEGLVQMSHTVISPLYLDDMLGVVAELAARVMEADLVALHLLDEGRHLVLRAAHGIPPRPADPLPLETSPCVVAEVARSGKPVAVEDLTRDGRPLEHAVAEDLTSMLGVPLVVRERVIGVMSCYTRTPHVHSEREIDLLSALANQTALAIDNASLVITTAVVREMNHRVKNNLQAVAMLLRMQMTAAGDERTRGILGDAMARILAIASVHETLSDQGLQMVDMRAVLERIATNVAGLTSGTVVDILVEGAPLTLPSKPATSLALVVNELVQNALKHAFVGRERGRVTIAITTEGTTHVVTVTDDGVGQGAPSQDVAPRKGLGLEIIRALVHDLHGQFAIDHTATGSRATVSFPEPGTNGAAS